MREKKRKYGEKIENLIVKMFLNASHQQEKFKEFHKERENRKRNWQIKEARKIHALYKRRGTKYAIYHF